MFVSVYVFLSITIVSTGRTLAKIQNVKKTFVDFDISHRMVSLRKLHYMTLSYFFERINVKFVYIWNGKS